MTDRFTDTDRFYGLLNWLETRLGGHRTLADCQGRAGWPKRGIYFFFEAGEIRSNSGYGGRVVRIGTHALKAGSRSTLWGRLSQHRGSVSGSGNHRGSIFRLLVGVALAHRRGLTLPKSWGLASDPGAAARRLGIEHTTVKRVEAELESEVSRHIGAMPFLWLNVDDEPGPSSDRGLIERNSIALLSGAREPAVDAPSPGWLGHESDRARVRRSGLWNNNHVDEPYDPAFLDVMERCIAELG